MQHAARLPLRRLRRAIGVACAGLLLAAGVTRAGDTPSYWAVTGVAPDDVLHLRDVPSAESRSLARIPFNAHGLKHLGCRRNQPALEQWMRMSTAQRREAQTEWCRVEYRGRQGWVAGRFLKKEPARP